MDNQKYVRDHFDQAIFAFYSFKSKFWSRMLNIKFYLKQKKKSSTYKDSHNYSVYVYKNYFKKIHVLLVFPLILLNLFFSSNVNTSLNYFS